MTRFVRCFGFTHNKSETAIARWLRRFKQILFLFAVLYAALYTFPQVLFPYSLSVQGVTLYSRSPLSPEAPQRIAEMMQLIQRSELAVPGRSERIFICNHPWLFRLLSPISGGAFAYSLPVTDNVFVANADLTNNVAHSAAPNFNTRSFSAVAAHEITHGLIRRRVGLLNNLPTWIIEGYCDYVAHESSFPETEGLRLLTAGKQHPSGSFRYFVFRQMVSYLIEDRHFSFQQILERADKAASVEEETLKAIKARNSQ
ncbi:hypothetical protein [Rivularia sp. UHCC 0363]|uniref:hypothetical protein n=1 Tax=Rivularia sp. UHCC 0363 TaxID=3110244 RepID=UPI002B212D2C|nr:hypothetical protein [Rivularia sp. UHCC 0363]MEA5597138.1 hypothetical protein [Rivularia sp. UHCC 0363]